MPRKGIVKGRRDDLQPRFFLLGLLLRRLLLELFYRTAKVGTAERRLRRDPVRGALPQLPLGFRGLERVRDGDLFVEPVALG